MRQLEIDNNLIGWTQLFQTNRKVEIFIDKHKNSKRDIETGIPQGLLVSPILFCIYIIKVFDMVIATL